MSLRLGALSAIGAACFFVACGPSKPQATHYSKSGNCPGPSAVTIQFFAEPSAHMFPGAVWLEECPNGRYYMRMGDLPWVEITKKKADNTTDALRGAGCRVVRVVDSR